MKFKLLLISIVLACKAYSQAYIPVFTDDKEWKIRYPDSVRIIKILGDTVANSKTYKILNTQTTDALNTTLIMVHSYVREDTTSRKCWILNKNKTTERILYDFTLNTYDTITLRNIHLPNPAQSYFTVDSICNGNCNTIFCSPAYINKATIKPGLKVYFLDGNSFVITFEYIEGVGSIFAPAYLDEIAGCGGNLGHCVQSVPELICCKKSTEILYFKDCYLSCDSPKSFSSGIDINTKQLNSFILQPNPATNAVSITNPINKPVAFKIYGSVGKLIFDEELQANQTQKINVAYLPKGIYYIKAPSFVGQKLILE